MAEHDQKTVTNLSIRATYDSLGEIMGENARAIIFRAAGLSHVLKTIPGYDWEKNFTNRQQVEIYYQIMKLVGAVGGQGILRHVGYKNAELSTVTFGLLDHIKDLPPDKRFHEAVNLLSKAIARGRISKNSAGEFAFDVSDCAMCRGQQSKKPYCSPYAGAIGFFADWSFGKGKYVVIETQCKALGDKTCFFELRPRW